MDREREEVHRAIDSAIRGANSRWCIFQVPAPVCEICFAVALRGMGWASVAAGQDCVVVDSSRPAATDA